MFAFLVEFSLLLLGFLIVRVPVNWYYNWKDPLLTSDVELPVSAEATLRKLKYKSKMANW